MASEKTYNNQQFSGGWPVSCSISKKEWDIMVSQNTKYVVHLQVKLFRE